MSDESEPTTLVPDSEYAAAAAEVVALHREATLGYALRLGQIVVDRLYGASIEAWRKRNPKDGNLRRLSDEVETLGYVVSPTTLQNAVGVLDIEKRVGVSARPQLTYTHVRAMLGLPADQQEALLGRAEAKNWDSTRMKKEAAKTRKRLVKHPAGRKPLPNAVKSINALQRMLDDEASFVDLHELAAMPEQARGQARTTARAIIEVCNAILSATGEPPADE